MPSKAQAGRPLKPPDPATPSATLKLAADLRALRLQRGVTLTALAAEIGYSPQHISGAELAKSPVSARFVAACDHALGAEGALVKLFPPVVQEAALLRSARSSARAGLSPALPCALPHCDVGDDVDPTNRRGLFGAALLRYQRLRSAYPSRPRPRASLTQSCRSTGRGC